MTKKIKVFIILGSIITLAMVAVPSVLYATQEDSIPMPTPSPTPLDDGNITFTLEDVIQIDFGGRYGQERQVLDIVEPKNERIIYWQSATEVGVIRWTDGLWVELMNIPIQPQEAQEVE